VAVTAPRTVAPAQVLTDPLLGGLTVPLGHSGVVLGRDQAGRPVLLRMFGQRPLSIAFVGGWWAAQILVHRCLGHGAAVTVDALDTGTPHHHATMAGMGQWLALDRMAAGSGTPAGRVRPMAGDATLAWPATAAQPLLRVHDVGPGGPAAQPPPPAWHTRLTVLARLTSDSLQLLSAADLVLAQRLEALEAGLVGSALLLAPEVVAQFPAMDNEMVVAMRGSAVRYAWLTPTATERQSFG
jgi:hypothetical protein